MQLPLNNSIHSKKKKGKRRFLLHEGAIVLFLFEEEDTDDYICELVGSGKWLTTSGRRTKKVVH